MLLCFVVYVYLLLYETYFFLFSYYYFNIYSFRILNGLLVLNCYEAEFYMEDLHLLDWKLPMMLNGWIIGLLALQMILCPCVQMLVYPCVQMLRCFNDLCCTWIGNPYMQPILCMVVYIKTTIFACIIPCVRILRHLSYFWRTFIF